MKPLAVTADPERLCVDYLSAALAGRGETATVSIGLPSTWTTRSGSHIGVALDGTPTIDYPALSAATIRGTAWAASTTEAKRLAQLAMVLLLTHPGSPAVFSVNPLTGLLPALDPDNGAPIASFTVRLNLAFTVL